MGDLCLPHCLTCLAQLDNARFKSGAHHVRTVVLPESHQAGGTLVPSSLLDLHWITTVHLGMCLICHPDNHQHCRIAMTQSSFTHIFSGPVDASFTQAPGGAQVTTCGILPTPEGYNTRNQTGMVVTTTDSTGSRSTEVGHPTTGELRPKKARRTRSSKKRERSDPEEVPLNAVPIYPAKVIRESSAKNLPTPNPWDVEDVEVKDQTYIDFHASRRAELVKNTLGLINEFKDIQSEPMEDSQPGWRLASTDVDPFSNWEVELAKARKEMKPHLKHRYGAMAACENGTCLCCAIDPFTATNGYASFMCDLKTWESEQPKIESTQNTLELEMDEIGEIADETQQ